MTTATQRSGLVRDMARAVIPAPLRRWARARHRAWYEWERFHRHLRRSDVFIVGHPKSGNTWLAYMVAILLRRDHEGRVTLRNVGAYVPTIHAAHSWETRGNDHLIAEHDDLPDPRFFRNEVPAYPHAYPRVVYLLRDPRAALVSYYHMYRIETGSGASFDDFLTEYLTYGRIRTWEPVGRWDKQVTWWLDRAARSSRVKVVRYEDMVRDRRSVLEAVARFAGIEYDDASLTLAVSRGSFDEMRRNEQLYGAEAYTPEQAQRGRFIRRGKVDGWKDEVGPAPIQRIESTFAAAMRRAGYL
jgi:hypothetical protein